MVNKNTGDKVPKELVKEVAELSDQRSLLDLKQSSSLSVKRLIETALISFLPYKSQRVAWLKRLDSPNHVMGAVLRTCGRTPKDSIMAGFKSIQNQQIKADRMMKALNNNEADIKRAINGLGLTIAK